MRPILSVALLASEESGPAFRRALGEVAGNDPALRVVMEEGSSAAVVQANNEAALQGLVERLGREFGIAVICDAPQVVYLETVRTVAEGEGKYIRQTGGMGNYGHVKLRLEPSERGSGVAFVNEARGGVVPAEYVGAIEQGIRAAVLGGILAGYEMVDFRAILYDGSYHAVDSNEMAFRIAGSLAFKEAAQKASPVVMEPWMGAVFTVHEHELANLTAVISDMRGHIDATSGAGGMAIVRATVPLRSMLRYEGPGAHFMEFSHYEPTRWPPDGGGTGVAVARPRGPRPKPDSAAADLDFDWS